MELRIVGQQKKAAVKFLLVRVDWRQVEAEIVLGANLVRFSLVICCATCWPSA